MYQIRPIQCGILITERRNKTKFVFSPQRKECSLIYAVSDLHGCYKKLLDTLSLGNADTLYVLGDVIDRDAGGIDILFDMISRSNIKNR